MRLSSRSQSEKRLELQMTSMIDVTFLLLIFFMISASFVTEERELDPAVKVNRPAAVQSSSPLQPAIVEIVAASSGKFVYRIGGREVTSAVELKGILAQFENKGDGAFLKVGDQAPFEMAAAGIHAAREAGFRNVSYLPLGSDR